MKQLALSLISTGTGIKFVEKSKIKFEINTHELILWCVFIRNRQVACLRTLCLHTKKFLVLSFPPENFGLWSRESLKFLVDRKLEFSVLGAVAREFLQNQKPKTENSKHVPYKIFLEF